MVSPEFQGLERKLQVNSKIQGTLIVKKQNFPILFPIIEAVFQKYDPQYLNDYITIKTSAKIDPQHYQ